MSQEKPVGNKAPAARTALQEIYNNLLDQSGHGFSTGVMNLSRLPVFDPDNGTPAPVPGQAEVKYGVIGFRRNGGKLTLAIACGTAMVLYLPLDKFVAVVEGMHDERSANVIVQNHKAAEKGQEDSRGQIIARLNPVNSAIQAVHGVVGKPIKSASDITMTSVYYVDRKDLLSFYLAAKAQLGTEDQLEGLIAAHDGWRGYSIPLNPLNAGV